MYMCTIIHPSVIPSIGGAGVRFCPPPAQKKNLTGYQNGYMNL